MKIVTGKRVAAVSALSAVTLGAYYLSERSSNQSAAEQVINFHLDKASRQASGAQPQSEVAQGRGQATDYAPAPRRTEARGPSPHSTERTLVGFQEYSEVELEGSGVLNEIGQAVQNLTSIAPDEEAKLSAKELLSEHLPFQLSEEAIARARPKMEAVVDGVLKERQLNLSEEDRTRLVDATLVTYKMTEGLLEAMSAFRYVRGMEDFLRLTPYELQIVSERVEARGPVDRAMLGSAASAQFIQFIETLGQDPSLLANFQQLFPHFGMPR
ncbi:MAG: hypothetical protein KDD70_05910 [Bdellovibrionales bacterium]|nr:hypothetical protein [Bdellovibrionales bacterium]